MSTSDLAGLVGELHSASDVPGIAVAAIKRGEVVLHEAFGVRGLESAQPVTTNSLFAIGSTTKAFTAAAIGTLVDDGLLDWQTPVRDYIPGFQMADPVTTERLTALDLLCHRSGVPSHDFVWLGFPERTRADIVARLRHLPPSKDLRQMFQYFNIGYITLGYLIEMVSGMPWEDYLVIRLFKPLGMDRSNTRISDLVLADDFCKAHERRSGEMLEIPYRVIDAIGPAGSINSCTNDMIGWLRVNATKPVPGEEEVISRTTLRKMQTPQVALGNGAELNPDGASSYVYGLGWQIGAYRGHRLVHHGGGIDGFSTSLMLLPDDEIGVVVLTNARGGSLGPIASRVLDELLDVDTGSAEAPAPQRGQSRELTPPPTETVALESVPSRPIEDYVGEYEHTGYGTFTISLVGGKLVPGFGTLLIRLAHSHTDVFDLQWRELTETVTIFPLKFHATPEGDVVALTVPFEAAVQPIRFERRTDPRVKDEDFLRSLTGTYENGPLELKLSLGSDPILGEPILNASVAGGPAMPLVHELGLRFVRWAHPDRQGQGSLAPGPRSFSFVLGLDGDVEKVEVRPLGTFAPA